MTITDAVGRIQQIQSVLSQLAAPSAGPVRATTQTPAPTSAMGAAQSDSAGAAPDRAFADALAAANQAKAAPAAPAAPAKAPAETSAPASSAAPVQASSTKVDPPSPEVAAPKAPSGPVAAPAPVAESEPVAQGGATGAAFVESAMKYEGIPYVWGGTDPAVGLDCSGFVQRAFKDIGVDVPRVTWDQMEAGTEVGSLAEARPGDLLFSLDGGHVSIYLGDGKAIDAPQPGQNIAVRDLWENDGNIDTIRRIVPAGDSAASVGGAALEAELLTAAQAAFASGRSL